MSAHTPINPNPPFQPDVSDLIAKSAAMRTLVTTARRLASHHAAILLTGESGSGKEVLARLIHAASPRAAQAFVPVSCAALSPALMESDLFGHARGAFTGADAARRGLAETAEGGTLFLDEIGETPFDLQVKLLRFLQDGEFCRLGETVVRRANVRLVASTSRDLAADIASGRFREDLFHRLNVLPLHVPPLRERPEDIAALAQWFVRQSGHQMGREGVRLTADALAALQRHSWPGNVRELRNVIEQSLVLTDGARICAADLPPIFRKLPQEKLGLSIPRNTRVLEQRLIREALAASGENRTKAAKLLEISPRALAYKLKARSREDED